jgi:hypothetical protein
MKKLPFILSAVAALGAVFATPSMAGTADTAKNPPQMQVTEPDNGWWYRVAPYIWGTSITGHTGFDPYSVKVDASFGDLLKHFDLGFQAVSEVGYGRWSLGVDVMYARLSGGSDTAGPLFSSAHVTMDEWFITPFVTYNAFKTDQYSFDMVVGGRIFAMKTKLDLGGRAAPSLSFDDSRGWIDPIVGFRGRWLFGEKFFFHYYADIGGFDAASKLTWQALAGFGYRFNNVSSMVVGYRALDDDYHRNGFLLDLNSHGPYIGFEFRW